MKSVLILGFDFIFDPALSPEREASIVLPSNHPGQLTLGSKRLKPLNT